ncbi:prolyl oligopeptidase family serine peptidase [Chryseobacterium sp. 2987]|uniref:S9 family peptidase n=1 Tax=Chryseobacterium sp. 2987 TaxID=2817767 RepID=UPI002856D701|nr:prolyl oligopeptidase family serine peptidase [Chryseobacterium sp. 2987]MDR6919502.1 dipeptidyl aminopeptidase/acylaminoacyl peptidase [Chryseobacterium sp. 2987]
MGYLLIPAQKHEDTINSWRTKFATLGNAIYKSNNANWIGVHKISKQNGDSIFVISTDNRSQKVYRMMNSQLTFLNEDGVLGKQGQKAIFLNIKTGKTFEFDSVIKSYALEQNNRYGFLFKDNRLRFYDISGKPLLEINNVDDLDATDSKNKLYISKICEGKLQIVETSGVAQKIVYSTEDKIRKMELTSRGKYLVITETILNNDSDRLVILDTKNSGKKLLELNIPKKSIVKLSEIQEDKALLISARASAAAEKDSIVEIWYGNDPYVNEHYKKFAVRQYWIWHPKNGKLKRIAALDNMEINSLNNDRYFLKYIPRKGHNYITSEPELNGAQLFDIVNNTSFNLGDLKAITQLSRGTSRNSRVSSEIFCSVDGKWFLASHDGVKWILFSSDGAKKVLIDKTGLSQPVYSRDGSNIYFESNDGLWLYNIRKQQLSALQVGKGKTTKILNFTLKWNDQYKSAIPFFQTEKILVEIYDQEENMVSYSLLNQGKWFQVIPPTKNRINGKYFIYDPGMTSFYTLEENYNLPPALYKYNGAGQKHFVFNGNNTDHEAKRIKQQIYSYSAVGKNLKGILYYPINFSPSKIYPMIVNIYELQRQISNEYLSPNNLMPVGIHIRTLLEQGYFVYLPDIAYGPKGTGLSAMDCVNNALDAVLNNANINPAKIGLIGHSHGGYETNFIATHSDRFATYVSGAGNSDIIRSYYSYNLQFGKPFYFQFETGQYDMGTSISENKKLYLKNNPILNVDKVNAPILLWAGKKDENIQWDQVIEFYMGLRRYKKNVIALFYPKGGHDLVFEPVEAEDRNRKILQWWDYFLKDITNVPWINKQMKEDAH